MYSEKGLKGRLAFCYCERIIAHWPKDDTAIFVESNSTNIATKAGLVNVLFVHITQQQKGNIIPKRYYRCDVQNHTKRTRAVVWVACRDSSCQKHTEFLKWEDLVETSQYQDFVRMK
jgi:hypothetical protein